MSFAELAGKFGDKKEAPAALEAFKAAVEGAGPQELVESYGSLEALVEAVASKDKPTAKAAEECLKAVYLRT